MNRNKYLLLLLAYSSVGSKSDMITQLEKEENVPYSLIVF